MKPNRQEPKRTEHNATNDHSGTEAVISVRQSASMIASTLIGAGVLTLPRSTVENAKQDGWISTLLGAVITMIAVFIITKLNARFPGKSIVQYSAEILGIRRSPIVGRIVSIVLSLAYVAVWGAGTVVVARIFGEVVITTVLKQTPLEVIIFTMLLTGLVLTLYDIEVLARVNEILLPIIMFPILLIAFSSFQSANFVNLFPIFTVDWRSLMNGIVMSSASYLGFEIMTVFLGYTQQSKGLLRANLFGVALPGFVYVLIVFAGISVFGVKELMLLTWPTLELVKTTEVPILVLERLESAFLGVWVAAVFTSVGNLYYAAAYTAKQVLGVRSHRWIAAAMLPLFYWLSLQPQNIFAIFQYQAKISIIESVLAFVLPAILLMMAVIRKKGNPGLPAREEGLPEDSDRKGASSS